MECPVGAAPTNVSVWMDRKQANNLKRRQSKPLLHSEWLNQHAKTIHRVNRVIVNNMQVSDWCWNQTVTFNFCVVTSKWSQKGAKFGVNLTWEGITIVNSILNY